MAAAVTGYTGSIEFVPPEIGAMRFYKKSWGDNAWFSFTEIETRPCTRADFDYEPLEGEELNAENPTFYRTSNTAFDLRLYGLSMKCVKNPDDMVIWGNYNTGNAAAFQVVFEMCDVTKGEGPCAPDEDILEWMSGRYFITLENQRKFIQHRFGDARILRSEGIE